MAIENFWAAKKLVRDGTPIEVLIMAIVLSSNFAAWVKLGRVWPEIVAETVDRESGKYMDEETVLND